jgi:hypothetical protein
MKKLNFIKTAAIMLAMVLALAGCGSAGSGSSSGAGSDSWSGGSSGAGGGSPSTAATDNGGGTSGTSADDEAPEFQYSINSSWVLISGYNGDATSVRIPESIGGMPVTSTWAAFAGSNITEVFLPDSMTNLGSRTFSGCTGLTSIELPNGLTEIGGEAFRGCTGLTSIVIPDSVTKIGDEAFRGCTNLSHLTLSAGITLLGEDVFRDVPNLVVSYKGADYDSSEVMNAVALTNIGYEIAQFGGYHWVVLDKNGNNSLLLLLGVLPEQQPYHSEEMTWEGVTWEASTIRQYLNDDFYNTIEANDRAKIIDTRVVNNDNPRGRNGLVIPGGNDTTDKIFLLSNDEAELYFPDNATRIGSPEDNWWLRSPGGTREMANYVNYNGRLSGEGSYAYYKNDVRPAMWVTLE